MDHTKVLIVEDEALIAEELHDWIEKLGHTVVGVVDSAVDAVVAARDAGPGLILMDVRLKGEMDGIAAAMMIGDASDVPIVFMTAHSDSDTIGRAMLTQPFGYVVKPVREANLAAAIQTALFRHAAEDCLRGAEGQSRAIEDRASDLIFHLFPHGRVLSANRIARSRLGYTPAQFCRLGLIDLVAEGDKDAVANALASLAESSVEVDLSATLRTRDGGEIRVKGVVGRRMVGEKVDRLWAIVHPLVAWSPPASEQQHRGELWDCLRGRNPAAPPLAGRKVGSVSPD